MRLLRIGRETVNMDQVLSIYDTDEEYRLIFGFGAEEHQVWFVGDDYQVFSRWLDSNATNLTPSTPDDQEWEQYKRNVGEMNREQWEAARREHRDVSAMLDSLDPTSDAWKRQMDRASRLEGRLGY